MRRGGKKGYTCICTLSSLLQELEQATSDKAQLKDELEQVTLLTHSCIVQISLMPVPGLMSVPGL